MTVFLGSFNWGRMGNEDEHRDGWTPLFAAQTNRKGAAKPAFISSHSLMPGRGEVRRYRYQFINTVKRSRLSWSHLVRYLMQETTGSSLPTSGTERGHRGSQLITLCRTGIMIPSSSLLFCGLVSVFLVYSLNPKVEGALATDYSSSILYYHFLFFKWAKWSQNGQICCC